MSATELFETAIVGWWGDATSVFEFMHPLRYGLDMPGAREVCVNRPGEVMVETFYGWQTLPSSRDDVVKAPARPRLIQHLPGLARTQL